MNKKTILKKLFFISQITLYFIFSSCSSQKTNKVVIWTSCREFVQYQELFNNTHPDCKVIIAYKENPALSLPPAKDELPPDIIIGNWLNSDDIIGNFKSLDFLFDRKNISSSIFYPQLLEMGKKRSTQYLLPVSFNLPCVIFSNENKTLIQDNYTLSLDQIRDISKEFNSKKKNNSYTKMGFTPTCNEDFLYLVTKLFNTDFYSKNQVIHFNKENLQKSIDYIKEWTTTYNTSVQNESDFSFKYLQCPIYRQVTSGKLLFAYTTSDQIFKILHEQDLNIDYRWISQDGNIPIEDSNVMLGIYDKTDNLANASEFITWFFRPETQDSILKRKNNLSLDTDYFGIAGGFSSIIEVTEKILPIYYIQTISNLPPSQMLQSGLKYNARWDSYKSKVIQQYIQSEIINNQEEPVISFDEYEKEWQKKVFD